jgi:hypothetical protein
VTDSIPKIAQHLIDAGQLKRDGQDSSVLLFSVALGIANLMLYGVMDGRLRHDPTSYYLSLILFIEIVIHGSILFFDFKNAAEEIILKTRSLPVGSLARLTYFLGSALRNRMVVSLWVSNVVGTIAIFGIAAGAWGAILYSLLLLNVTMLTGFVLLVLARHQRSSSIVGVLSLIGLVFLVLVFVLMSSASLVMSIPHILWTVNGMNFATAGLWGQAVYNGVLLLASPALVLVFARRYC